MKVFEESKEKGETGDAFVLLLNKAEAKTLVEIAEAACLANKRKSTFKTIKCKLEACLYVY